MNTSQEDDVLVRAVEHVYPSKEALRARLKTGKPMRIYNGFDPTGPSLHIGHGAALLKLKEFQDRGHHIIFLIGDFTAMIGDPSDKTAARRKLSREEVLENCKNYVTQASAILDMSKVEVRYNSEWLAKMSFADVLELTSNFTVSQMIERDMFKRRIEENQPIYLHEFLYPTMQGYDSVALDVEMEIGGNDQTFNMLAGRTLMSKQGKEKFVLGVKLLTDPTGKKMGKSEGNMVTMDDTPENMYGKVMSWPDSLLPLAFEVCTRVPMDEIKTVLEGSPRDAKMRLAREITAVYHGEAGGLRGESYFVRAIQNKEVPDDIASYTAVPGTPLSDIALEAGLVRSKSEFSRLVKEGGVSLEGEVIEDIFHTVERTVTLKIGKLRYLKIIVS